MPFSLSYAFGGAGRHIRKISREARAFIGAKFRNLEPGPVRDQLFAQYLAIDGTLFKVFYNDDRKDPFYRIHKTYANKLLDATAADFRHLARAYALSFLTAHPVTRATEEEMTGRLCVFDVI